MRYEITTPARNDIRHSMNCICNTLAEARKEAIRLARRDQKAMFIERVTKTGKSTVLQYVPKEA